MTAKDITPEQAQRLAMLIEAAASVTRIGARILHLGWGAPMLGLAACEDLEEALGEFMEITSTMIEHEDIDSEIIEHHVTRARMRAAQTQK